MKTETRMIFVGGEWMPDPKAIRALFRRNPDQNVVVALHKGKKLLDFVFGKNIVTTAGEIYYAQRACGESPSPNNFTTMWLASNGPATPGKTNNRGNFTDIAASNKGNSTGYPKSNDNDVDNTGASNNTISWLHSYNAADGNFANIGWCYITNSGNTANDALLCSVHFGANWNKDSNTSAKVFVNHAENGV